MNRLVPVLIALCACVSIPAYCEVASKAAVSTLEVSPAKKALIDTLLRQTGQSVVDAGTQVGGVFVQQFLQLIKNQRPDIEPRFAGIVEKEVNGVVQEMFVAGGSFDGLMHQIYGSRITESELAEIIRFNDSRVGRKLILSAALHHSRKCAERSTTGC